MASSIETTSTTTTLKNNGNTYATVDTNDDVTITNDLAVSGDVGIGTTAPIAKLDLNSGDIAISSTQASDNGDLGEFQFWNRTNAGSGVGGSFVNDVAAIQGKMEGTGNNSGGSLHFYTKTDGGDKVERMSIDGAGTVVLSAPLPIASGGTGATSNAGKVLQVVTLTKVDEWTTTSNSFVDVTGLVLSITPTSTSSKILVTASVAFSAEGTSWGEAYFRLARGGASLAVGTASGNNTNNCAFGGLVHKAGHSTQTGVTIVEDSPATTSAVSYSVQAACSAASSYGNIVYVNDSAIPSTDYSGNGISTITLMEIGA